MIRRVLLLLVAIVFAAACSSDSPSATPLPERDAPDISVLPPADPDNLGEAEDAEPEVPPVTDDGRLVVQRADGQLVTMLPDGSDTLDLTDGATVNIQASWAPDGSRIAWVEHDLETGTFSLSTDRYDRSDLIQIPIDQPPFYLAWDPSAARIAHLSNSAAGIDLSIAEPFADDGPTNRRVDRGQPYFLAWGPDGDELLVHASGFRLDRIDLAEATIIIDEFPASFGSAAWLADDSLVFADIEDDQQFLVTAGSRGEGRRPLVTYVGSLRFAVNNDGNRVVMQAAPARTDDPIVTASTSSAPGLPEVAQTDQQVLETLEPALANFQGAEPTPTPEFDDSLDPVDAIQPLIPYAMGTFGGEPFALSDQPAFGIFPSPDGRAIAWFQRAGPDQLVFRVDFAGTILTGPTFTPSETMARDYLPFFDQYEISHDFWSPSSNLFVFAGRPAGLNTDAIWIYDRSTGEISRLTDGVVASFTRTPEAGGAASSL